MKENECVHKPANALVCERSCSSCMKGRCCCECDEQHDLISYIPLYLFGQPEDMHDICKYCYLQARFYVVYSYYFQCLSRYKGKEYSPSIEADSPDSFDPRFLEAQEKYYDVSHKLTILQDSSQPLVVMRLLVDCRKELEVLEKRFCFTFGENTD